MGNNPTMKDVAREAGVALGTVSKVFNGIPVGEDYRIKVEKAAKKLNYKVNDYARGLKTNKTNVVACILPSVIHPYFSALAQHCTRALEERGYSVLLAITDGNVEAEKQCFSMAQQKKVDGIICLSYNPDLRENKDFPLVSIDRYFDARVPCVCSDNFGGGQLAAQKLAEFGSRHLVMFRDAAEIPGETDKRPLGFAAYCQQHDLDYRQVNIYGSKYFQEYYDYMDEHIIDGKADFDGIFCDTDHLAYKTIQYLRFRNIRIPEDVQVIGFDGLRCFGGDDLYCSTIVQPVEEIARACVNILLDQTSGTLPPLMNLPVSYAYGGTTRDPEFYKSK